MFSKLFPFIGADLIIAMELILATDTDEFYFEAGKVKLLFWKVSAG